MILLFLFAITFENKNKIYDYGIVSIESISSDGVWLVRGHGDGNGYGSPYQFVFNIVINADGIAEAIGFHGESVPNKKQREFVGEFLSKELGTCPRVHFIRYRNKKITNNTMGFD